MMPAAIFHCFSVISKLHLHGCRQRMLAYDCGRSFAELLLIGWKVNEKYMFVLASGLLRCDERLMHDVCGNIFFHCFYVISKLHLHGCRLRKMGFLRNLRALGEVCFQSYSLEVCSKLFNVEINERLPMHKRYIIVLSSCVKRPSSTQRPSLEPAAAEPQRAARPRPAPPTWTRP